MSNLGYIPFAGSSGDTTALSVSLPYSDLKNIYNFTVGGIASVASSDTLATKANTQSALNLVGQFNPLVKAAISTATGSSLYGNKENDGS